ncbi:MAG: M23 family metallopeptidase [Alphaproteobacteria bacterium]|nr:M23 family metallopeptidase [Alphaproteobacteria bacterium]
MSFRRRLPFKTNMQGHLKYVLLSVALIAGAGLSACGERQSASAPVLNLGLHADSAAGAVIIREGDTLWNISRRYRLPVRDIMDLNGLEPPYALAKGGRLKLPAPLDYRVRGGDTLYSVANMFGVAVYQLVRVNNIAAPYAVRPGQDLRIPATERRAVLYKKEDTLTPTLSRRVGEGEVVREIRPLPRAGEGRGEGVVHRPLPTTLAASKRPDFVWPVRGKVVSAYGAKEGGLYNDGINIAAPKGTPVAAAADGVVAYVGDDLKSYGNLVLVRHGGGAMTAYAHLGSVNVKKGMTVRKGQAIGSVGSTGAVSAAQLHFEIRQGAKTYDPRQYLG